MMEADEYYIETMRCIVDQKNLNKRFRKEGFNDAVLEEQLKINERREEMDLQDNEEVIFVDKNEKKFVQ